MEGMDWYVVKFEPLKEMIDDSLTENMIHH